MSPPEIWGPAVWCLIHTLSEKINDYAFPFVFPGLFKMIARICKFLPCPECSMDASNYLAKVQLSNIRNKTDFKNTFYIFHNWVNAKKRKQLFNYSHIFLYTRYNLIQVVNNFISKYQTKGNMKLLSESFQRQFVIKDFKNWFQKTIKAFVPVVSIPPPVSNQNIIEHEKALEEPAVIVEETVVEETIIEEHEVIVEETVVEEPAVIVEETVVEEPAVIVEETIIEESEEIVEEPAVIVEETAVIVEEPAVIVEETVVEEPAVIVEETIIEEPAVIVEEPAVIVEEPIEHVVEEPLVEPLVEEPLVEPLVEEHESSNNLGININNIIE
jgi:hypothetical protein